MPLSGLDVRGLFVRGAGLACLLIAACAVLPGRAGATVILSENFNRANGTNMSGATPDVANLPGGTFSLQVTGWTATAQSNQLQIGADISMMGYLGSYNTGVLRLQADVSTSTLSGSSDTGNLGVGLGFNSSSTGSWSTFSGIKLSPIGDLVFEVNGTVKASVSVGTITGTPQTLAYCVNMATGAISNITLQGSAANFSSIIAAANGADYFGTDDYVSVFGGGASGGQFALVDNLSVSSVVPEPESMGLFGVSLAGLMVMRRRRLR